jgi:hypothetical protein
MSEFKKALEETAVLHRRSDLENLANAHNDLDEFIREVIEPLRAEIVRIGESEQWPEEGIIWDVYNRVRNLTMASPDIVIERWREFKPTIPYRL